jgi:hypothetical protein
LKAARDFRDSLRADLSLDLSRYYESRFGSYSENWYPLPKNPWTPAKFDQVRRAVANHILALRRASAPSGQ